MSLNIDRRAPRFIFATVAASLLIISACAGVRAQPGKQASAQAGGEANAGRPGVICTMERSVGSNIPERICRYVGDIEEERERTQQELMNRPPVQMRGN